MCNHHCNHWIHQSLRNKKLASCPRLPSPAPIYLHIIYLPFLLYLIFYIILIQALQTFRNRRNTSPFFCKQKAFTQCNRHVS
ncbi:hypothetical protein FEJ01_20215 [Escherichia coli]|nr:hypothetical protein [Escherichia coli]